MKLFNSRTSTIEELQPLEPGKVSMYVCGPTVYNYPHIGNARPIVVFDTLKKALEAQGYEVTYVSNYTDVDDKIIQAALEQNTDEKTITDAFIEAYAQTRRDLNADQPDVSPRVTETMDEIIRFIDELVKSGAAYQAGDDVYYRVSSDPMYGELSHQKPEDLEVGARIEENTTKENPLDFTLWKKTAQGIQWESPWSKGRPGWHTECVVMIQNVFGKNLIDIHGGGMDLKFPHHENEIAQCRSLHDTPLANMWVHNGMINIDGLKMSKSLGNVWWAKDLIQKFGGNVVRWVMITTHYRAPLNLNEEAFDAAARELEKIRTAMKQASVALQLADWTGSAVRVPELWDAFMTAMDDDLNTPNATAAVFETVKKLNQAARTRTPDLQQLADLEKTLEDMLYVLGIRFDLPRLSDQDKALWHQWKDAVKARDFETADTCRATLQARDIL
ncbi:cysteine--tRNA ligase [uncultured Faecalibaculum sp.]|uniref:cysteine--tRNA ligase n=2 Tax=uncultured Faecalibaculum sp. TaxID=1729681 RepID=UPI0025E5A39B|nr:cysteine--tRNA ligase [uncultured Faecalibaculum sp.]